MPPSEERKLVSVLFGDLVGSTELARQRDPEQFRAMLSAFFEEMAQQIHAFGGTVEKYAGDAIMAVFGVPQVHEDDAERAVRAAVAMQQSLGQLLDRGVAQRPHIDRVIGVRYDVAGIEMLGKPTRVTS